MPEEFDLPNEIQEILSHGDMRPRIVEVTGGEISDETRDNLQEYLNRPGRMVTIQPYRPRRNDDINNPLHPGGSDFPNFNPNSDWFVTPPDRGIMPLDHYYGVPKAKKTLTQAIDETEIESFTELQAALQLLRRKVHLSRSPTMRCLTVNQTPIHTYMDFYNLGKDNCIYLGPIDFMDLFHLPVYFLIWNTPVYILRPGAMAVMVNDSRMIDSLVVGVGCTLDTINILFRINTDNYSDYSYNL